MDLQKRLEELLEDKNVDNAVFKKRTGARHEAWFKVTALSNLVIAEKLEKLIEILSNDKEPKKEAKKGKPKKE